MKAIEVHKIHAFLGHQAAIYSITEGLDEHCILSAGADKMVTSWDLDLKLNTNFSAKLPSGIYSLLWLKEQQHLLIGTINGSLHIIDLGMKQEIKHLKLHQGGIFSILHCDKYNRVITSGNDGKLQVLEIDNYQLIHSLAIGVNKLRKQEKNNVRDELYVTESDGSLHVLSLYNFKVKFSFRAHQHGCNCIALHPNKRFMLTGGRDAYINVWDMEMQYKMVKAIPAHNFAIYDIKFSPNGQLFASASRDKTVKLWDTESLEFLVRLDEKTYKGHVNSVNTILWKLNHLLISSGDDRSIILWEIKY
jgi:WD repeat-containing protein 61